MCVCMNCFLFCDLSWCKHKYGFALWQLCLALILFRFIFNKAIWILKIHTKWNEINFIEIINNISKFPSNSGAFSSEFKKKYLRHFFQYWKQLVYHKPMRILTLLPKSYISKGCLRYQTNKKIWKIYLWRVV